MDFMEKVGELGKQAKKNDVLVSVKGTRGKHDTCLLVLWLSLCDEDEI